MRSRSIRRPHGLDAVDAEVRQLADGLGVGLLVASERDAVHVDVAVNHVDFEQRTAAQVDPDLIVELLELLRDHRMPDRIGAHQPPEAGEPPEHVHRIGRRHQGGGWNC